MHSSTMPSHENSFNNKFQMLKDYIKDRYSVEEYSTMFFSIKQNHFRVGMSYCLLDDANLLPAFGACHPKSSSEATYFRTKGNKEFAQKKDLLAIQTYSASAAFAPSDSEELSLAFANRSAVTFSLTEYKTCIKDIDRALSGRYPDHLRYKLYERKAKCFKCLGMNVSAMDFFQLALESLGDSQLDKEKLESVKLYLTEQLNSCTKNDICHKTEQKCQPSLSVSQNDVIMSASSLLRIEYSPELGRHLIATADIEPGDVLVIEEPFASVLLPGSYNNYCFHCKKRCHSLIPCHSCVVVMYCCEVCRATSWLENHSIECSLVPILIILNFTKIELIAVRTLLMAVRKSRSLQTLLDTVLETDMKIDPKTWGLDENGLYNSGDYRTVHCLVGNMELRNNADVFRKATIAAYILHLLDKNTDFFSSVGECNIPDERFSDEFKDFKTFAGLDAGKLFVGGLLLKYLTIVPSNAHEISEMVMKKDCEDLKCESVEIGGALYPVLSLINHSCDPNVVRHSYNGDTVVLTAVQCIAAGEQLFDNYGYHHAMHDVQTRQSGLRSQYHFSCQCLACMEDWPVYAKMPNANPTFLNLRLKEEAEKSSEIFQDVLSDIKSGTMEGKLPFLYAHLSLLHKTIKRPWKEYSECQEAIKQCLSVLANHYMTP